jgi:hypothetical protein
MISESWVRLRHNVDVNEIVRMTSATFVREIAVEAKPNIEHKQGRVFPHRSLEVICMQKSELFEIL